MTDDLLIQHTPESAIGVVQNYLAVAHRYNFEPEPEFVIELLKDMGYGLRRLPRKKADAEQQSR